MRVGLGVLRHTRMASHGNHTIVVAVCLKKSMRLADLPVFGGDLSINSGLLSSQ